MAFAKTTLFTQGSAPSFQPFEPVETMRKRFSPDTKVMIAIGGWGDTEGFSQGAKDDASREQFAKNVASVLDSNGFDGVGENTGSISHVSQKLRRHHRYRLGVPGR